MNDRLNVINIKEDDSQPSRPKHGREDTSRTEVQARFERLWLNDPEQFNPERTLMERERITRTKVLLEKILPAQTCVDLGTGYGVLALFLAEKGCRVTAVDIAKNALKRLEGKDRITTFQDYVPDTKLQDNLFDIVMSTDFIAYLNRREYRLYVSELVRLCKHDGVIICSTPIDIHTDDALNIFASLVDTEIIVDEWSFSYHRLFIRCIEILEKIGLSFIAGFLKEKSWFLNGCEKISQMIWEKNGVSHAIFKGHKKPLMPLPPKSEIPIERKEKRSVWE